ncbi:MAG: mannose-6-phosphate isomerase [Pedosphaera sp.]|nr:mannose-6-phosphate isomerase [Pedosphaera sp.]
MLYPLAFQPRFKDRIWGGRQIESLFGKELPPDRLIGESWEISDRPGDVSVVANGPLAGKDLRWLMENFQEALMGSARPTRGRFPLLVKILDAQEKLSLQVHPPSAAAANMGDEPKTEMWYVVDAVPDAELYLGLKRGTTRQEFERRIKDSSVQDCFHRIKVRRGDSVFLPSGRVHALGAGLVIFEVQQNSDTTYRVHDWDRLDTSGNARELHISEALASIDFDDIEPPIMRAESSMVTGGSRELVSDPVFQVSEELWNQGCHVVGIDGRPVVIGMISGAATVEGNGVSLELVSGGFALLPACLSKVTLACASPVRLIRATPG